MEKIKFYLDRYKIYISATILGLFIIGILVFIIFNKGDTVVAEEIKIDDKVEEIILPQTIKVDVKGRVEKVGVYELEIGSRVIDAINKAGGLKKDANTDYINLSKKVTDEMIIIIYSNDEVKQFKEEDKEIIYIEYECVCPDNINDSCITEDDTVNTTVTSKNENDSNDETDSKDDLVSINKGTKEELMTLPGIGEAKAESIINFREENGQFEKLEDIMNVSGIGDAAYSKIKDYIKL